MRSESQSPKSLITKQMLTGLSNCAKEVSPVNEYQLDDAGPGDGPKQLHGFGCGHFLNLGRDLKKKSSNDLDDLPIFNGLFR